VLRVNRPPISTTDWRQPDRYVHLQEADRRMFAWEWLRRCPAYRRAWLRYADDAGGRIASRVARRFALVALEDPAKDARTARPVWRSERDPHVVSADSEGARAASADLFDILRLAPVAHVAITSDGSEHWLFSNGEWLLRLDVVEGTLLGGPTLLRFRLEGLAGLPPRLATLGDLVRLLATPEAGLAGRATRRKERWIAELRTADALHQGASHRQIARSLFGDMAGSGWRLDSDAYRLRVQRLVRSARNRLVRPLSQEWFA
jgi:hypothetical protein